MKIRLWKLGSLEHKVFPSEDSIKKFRKILEELPKDDDIQDIVWGPDIDCLLVDTDSADDWCE